MLESPDQLALWVSICFGVAALILLAIGLGYYVRLQRCGIRLRQEQWRYLRGLSRYDSQTRLAVVDDLPIVIGGNHNPSN